MSPKSFKKLGWWGAFALAFTVGLGASFIPSCGTSGCNPAQCSGCCGSDGICNAGNTAAACGSGGGVCTSCSASETCNAGVCSAGTGNCAANCTGCCAPNGACITPSNIASACGAAGGACQVCTGNQTCTNGNCVDSSCTGCVTQGACVTGNADSACGTGGVNCQTCSGGSTCSNGSCTGGSCNASNCPNGCCNNGACVAYASQNGSTCGTGGAACAACSGGATCSATGACQGGSCNSSSCASGCCNGGSCVAYTSQSNSSCGTGGAACAACTGGTTCSASGSCQSGTCQTGNPCTQHTFPLCTSTSTCVATICQHDPGCCTTGWNSVCAAFDVNTYCPGQCGGGFDGGVSVACPTPATNFAACPSSPCGTERWDVKTTTDPGAASISTSNIATSTVMALTALPTITPSSSAPRMSGAPESQIYFVQNAILTHLVPETDEDYHLVLSDPTNGHTMIGEIPCPNCASGGVFECRITHARAQFEAQFGANPADQNLNMTVSVVGIGYYDPPHGQTGAAVNNLELHPLLGICFTQNCDPTAN